MLDMQIEILEIERKARQMRAEAMRAALSAVTQRIRGLFAGTGAQTAH